MSSLQSVSQPTIDANIDVEKSFQLWTKRTFERNPDLAKKINYIYQIDIKRRSNSISTWILDLTNGSGSLTQESKADIKCIVTIEESDLIKAILDKSHLHTIFWQKKMGLKGSRVALEKLQQFWVEADKCNHDFKLVNRELRDTKTLIDSIVSNGFKSDIIFHTLKNRMHEEEDIVRKLTGVMQFDITKNDIKSVWTIDFSQPLGKNVYPGPPKDSPICILTMNDEDFVKMMVNKFNPQKAFMMGKMKVKGQILSIYKLFTVWVDAAFKKKRAPEVPYIENLLLNSDLIPGLKSEIIVFRVIQRLVKCPQLCSEVGGVFYFDITKGEKLMSKWKLDFTVNKSCGQFSRQPLNIESPTETLIIIEDEDFVLMALNKLNIEQAMESNRIKGEISLATKLTKIFQSPIIQSKL